MTEAPPQGQPMRRPRGRHAQPKPGAASAAGWRARLEGAAAPLVAWIEPRISTAGAWLFERRLHVLIVGATVATVAMLGGAVALISLAGAPQPDDEASTIVDATRPTSSDPAAPSTFAPILPSPGPTPSLPPITGTPAPGEESDEPTTDAPAEPTTEPSPTEAPRRDTAPGATNRPEKPDE